MTLRRGKVGPEADADMMATSNITAPSHHAPFFPSQASGLELVERLDWQPGMERAVGCNRSEERSSVPRLDQGRDCPLLDTSPQYLYPHRLQGPLINFQSRTPRICHFLSSYRPFSAASLYSRLHLAIGSREGLVEWRGSGMLESLQVNDEGSVPTETIGFRETIGWVLEFAVKETSQTSLGRVYLL